MVGMGLLDCRVGNSMFAFLRTLCTGFHSDYDNLYSHQQCRSAPFLHTLASVAVLTGMRWFIIVDLFFSSN